MATWDYADLSAMIARGAAGEYTLSPAAQALFLSALSSMSELYNWRNAGELLTSGQWDVVDNWVATAYNDLFTEYTCPGGGDGVTVDEFYKYEDNGDWGTIRTAGLFELDFPEAHAENEGNVDLETTDYEQFDPDPGLYIVDAEIANWSQKQAHIYLYNDTDEEIAIQGINSYEYAPKRLRGLLRVVSGDLFTVYERITEGGYDGRAILNNGLDEYYRRILWERIGD